MVLKMHSDAALEANTFGSSKDRVEEEKAQLRYSVAKEKTIPGTIEIIDLSDNKWRRATVGDDA